jgi:hypothetical protein
MTSPPPVAPSEPTASAPRSAAIPLLIAGNIVLILISLLIWIVVIRIRTVNPDDGGSGYAVVLLLGGGGLLAQLIFLLPPTVYFALISRRTTRKHRYWIGGLLLSGVLANVLALAGSFGVTYLEETSPYYIEQGRKLDQYMNEAKAHLNIEKKATYACMEDWVKVRQPKTTLYVRTHNSDKYSGMPPYPGEDTFSISSLPSYWVVVPGRIIRVTTVAEWAKLRYEDEATDPLITVYHKRDKDASGKEIYKVIISEGQLVTPPFKIAGPMKVEVPGSKGDVYFWQNDFRMYIFQFKDASKRVLVSAPGGVQIDKEIYVGP